MEKNTIPRNKTTHLQPTHSQHRYQKHTSEIGLNSIWKAQDPYAEY
jgi:hypothetical protein